MLAPAYMFQVSSFVRRGVLSSSFVRVCTAPTLCPRASTARSIRCLSVERKDPEKAAESEESTPSIPSPASSVPLNAHPASVANPTQNPEELLAAFESFIDDIDIGTEETDNVVSDGKRAMNQKLADSKEAYLRRLDILASLPHDLVVEPVRNKCPGCGSSLQFETPDRPGYLPKSILQENASKFVVPNEDSMEDDLQSLSVPKKAADPVCQRCYRLTHYGSIKPHLRVQTKQTGNQKDISKGGVDATEANPLSSSRELSPSKFRKSLERLRNLNAVVIYLVDIFDFHGTFIPSLRDVIGHKNPVVLAVNKVDLLPKNYKASRVEGWIAHECLAMGLRDVTSIHLVSSTKGSGVRALLADALRLAKLRRSDMFVVGAANVGKSSFINQLIRMRKKDQVRGRGDKERSWSRDQKTKDSGAITTSVVPGTTLDVIRVPLGGKVSLFDTPGLMMPHQLTNYLDEKELRAVVPSSTVEHVTFRLGKGKALFIGGLARLEVVEGKPFFFTCFFSPTVKIHPGRAEGAKEFALRHAGEILSPPYSQDRFLDLGEWTSKSFTAEGESWKKSCVDIVLSGLGWISVTGPGSARLKVWVPRGVGVFTREPLMPFEAETGVSRFTGTASINKKQMRKTVRRRRRLREE